VVFEQQIKRVARTQALTIQPILTYHQTTQVLDLKFPLALGHTPTDGEVLLFRPADLHKDRLFRLTLEGDSLQTIDLPDMDPGLWRIKLNWTSGGEEYYLEQSLMVN
jgi:nitrogen fixation protein FixH